MSFFCPSPVCLERERQRYRREKKKEKRERYRERKRSDSRDKLKNRGQIFGAIPFQPYDNRKNGLFVYLVLKIISNANMNSKLNKNWFLGVFPPNT